MPILSIIIVNYKSWAILHKNLKSLASFVFDNFELEIIVVDNCSNDGRFLNFSNEFLTIKFVENTGNWGFAHGCNLGASLAKGNMFLFLNPDTIANQKAIENMYLHYKSNSVAGIVSCRQSEKASSYQKIRPSIFTLFGLQRSFYKIFFKEKFINLTCEKCNSNIINPAWISGSVVMISKKWFYKVGGWNTAYWMYFEDVELSLKVVEKGGELNLLCDEFIIHEHGGASRINPKTAALTKTEVIISQHVYIKNNFPGYQKWLSHFLLLSNTLIFKGILGLLGLFFFFIPKANLQTLIFVNCMQYYFLALKRGTWMSVRSANNISEES